MADTDKSISQLDPLSIATGDDLLAVVDNFDLETKKITLSNLMGTPGPIGGNTPSSSIFTSLKLQSSTPIVTNISTNTSLGTSNTTIPTQGAVKAYVDAKTSQDNVRRISSDTTAVAYDIVLVDTTSGNVTIEMLDTSYGRIVIKKISDDSNQVIITSSSGVIDDQSQFTIITQYQSYNFLIDSGDFFVI